MAEKIERIGATDALGALKGNGVKLSVDALEILEVAQSHRVRTFFTRILSSRFVARWRLLKEPVQFVTDCFQGSGEMGWDSG